MGYRLVEKFPEIEAVFMDAGFKTPGLQRTFWKMAGFPFYPIPDIKETKNTFKPWDYTYDEETDTCICPARMVLRHTTTDKNGKKTYRSICKENCKRCPYREKCGANEKGQKILTRHIWQGYLDTVKSIRKTAYVKELYSKCQHTIEVVFGVAKENHAMRYTHHRGLTKVANWTRLNF